MSWFWTLIIGAIVGYLASILMQATNRNGIVIAVVLGVVGSVIGQVLGSAVGLPVQTHLGRWLVAVAGAAVLITVLRRTGLLTRLAAATR